MKYVRITMTAVVAVPDEEHSAMLDYYKTHEGDLVEQFNYLGPDIEVKTVPLVDAQEFEEDLSKIEVWTEYLPKTS